MTEDDEAYKYKIPLKDTSEGRAPVSDPAYNGEVYLNEYKGNHLVVVQSKPSPHLHKDSSEAEVIMVDQEKYE
jgi:hypothetical protein